MPHGGKRKGAGRKKKPIKTASPDVARRALDSVDEVAVWRKLLSGRRATKVMLEAMKYLSDRAYGKATQPVQASVAIRIDWGGGKPEWLQRSQS